MQTTGSLQMYRGHVCRQLRAYTCIEIMCVDNSLHMYKDHMYRHLSDFFTCISLNVDNSLHMYIGHVCIQLTHFRCIKLYVDNMHRDVYQWVEKPPVTGVAHRMTSLEGQGNSSGHCSTGCIFTFQPSLYKTET